MHVPGSRRTAFGAQSAVNAQVFIFYHYPGGLLERTGHKHGLVWLMPRSAQTGDEFRLFSIRDDAEADLALLQPTPADGQ